MLPVERRPLDLYAALAEPPDEPRKLDIDHTRERLLTLGDAVRGRAARAPAVRLVKHSTAPHAFLEQMLEIEYQAREARRMRTALRLSNLPPGQTLADFDFAFQPAIERSRIETLATCAFIRAAETVLIQGPPGVGKSHLASVSREGHRAWVLGAVLSLR